MHSTSNTISCCFLSNKCPVFCSIYLSYEPRLDFDGRVGLSWLAALTTLFTDDMAVDGITLDRGLVGLEACHQLA